MKCSCIIVAVSVLVVLLGQNVQGAVFNLAYLGTNDVKVSVGGSTYSVGAGRSVTVNTGGMDAIKNISWIETLVIGKDGQAKPGNSFDPDKDNLIENDFKLEFPRAIGAWNVGGTFTISANGEYAYYFGIDTDWKAVTGKAQQTAFSRRSW